MLEEAIDKQWRLEVAKQADKCLYLWGNFFWKMIILYLQELIHIVPALAIYLILAQTAINSL